MLGAGSGSAPKQTFLELGKNNGNADQLSFGREYLHTWTKRTGRPHEKSLLCTRRIGHSAYYILSVDQEQTAVC